MRAVQPASQRFEYSSVFRSGFTSTSSYRAASKADRLLRAAVTAFCANPRPTRREIIQFDDLTQPLLDTASQETLRFMAATLAHSSYAPPALVRRLAALPVEISAPLLMRSPALTPIDLLALIARHGLDHARVIAHRSGLDERILQIIHSLETADEKAASAPDATDASSAPRALDETRDLLRTMMQPAQPILPGRTLSRPSANQSQAEKIRWIDKQETYLKLRSTALAGTDILFHGALADALGLAPEQARAIAKDTDTARIIVALRALPLSAEEAFLIMQCVRPFGDRRGIAAFLDAWQAISQKEAARVVTGWRETAANTARLRAS